MANRPTSGQFALKDVGNWPKKFFSGVSWLYIYIEPIESPDYIMRLARDTKHSGCGKKVRASRNPLNYSIRP